MLFLFLLCRISDEFWCITRNFLLVAEAICDFYTNEFSCYDTGFDPESHYEYFSKIKFSFYRWLVYLSQRCLGCFFLFNFSKEKKTRISKMSFGFLRSGFLKRLLPLVSIKRAAKFFCLYFNDRLICIHTFTALSIFTTWFFPTP